MNEQNTPMALYRARLADGQLEPDPAQNLVVEKLNLLAIRIDRAEERKTGFASALFGWGREKVEREPLKGLYIYGDVGRGKSMLMQLFVDAMGARAWRVHFHEFMQDVQKQLAQIRQGKTKDPLDEIAAQISQRADVLCLDEMQIENIADAMIVGRLFGALFDRDMVLVTTSNRHPDALYEGGLNRKRFLPFIELIKSHCEIVSLDGKRDYRGDGTLANDGDAQRYFIRDDAGFAQAWAQIPGASKPKNMKLAGREWHFENTKGDAVNLTFSDACEQARGAQDYQALADQFKTIFLADIPKLGREKSSAASRFVTLIDILYEAKTKIFLSFDVPPDEMHEDRETGFVFARTLSRLHEMGQESWPE